jgi:hypothetical protein
MRLGRKEASDDLARKINVMIADVVPHPPNGLADSGVRELWHAVKAKKCVGDNSRISRLTLDVDVMNKVKVNIFLQQFLQKHLSDQNKLYVVGNLQVRLTYMERRLRQPYIYYSLAPQVHDRTSTPSRSWY